MQLTSRREDRIKEFKKAARTFAVENHVPYGLDGLIAITLGGPVAFYVCLKFFGLASCLYYAVPIFFLGAIFYAESSLATHED